MSFSLELQPHALKVFGCALDLLAKFGDELNIEAKRAQVILSIYNSSMTGQAVIRLSPKIFSNYVIRVPPEDTSQSTACRVLVKPLQKIFRRNQHNLPLLRHCKLDLKLIQVKNMTERGIEITVEHRFVLKYVYESGTTKTNSLWYDEGHPTRQLFSKNDKPSTFAIDAAVFYNCITLMDPQIQEVALVFTSQHVTLKSYWDFEEMANENDQDTPIPIASQFRLGLEHFKSYNMHSGSTTLVFNLWDFKAVLSYSIEMMEFMHGCFVAPGRPFILTIEQRGIVIADFALSTHKESEVMSQTSESSLNNISITTGDSVHSVSHHHTPQQRQEQEQRRQQPISNSSSFSSSMRPSQQQRPQQQQQQRRSSSVGPPLETSPSLDMIPPSFQRDRTGSRDRANDHPLFPFGSVTPSSQPQPTSASNNNKGGNGGGDDDDDTTEDEQEEEALFTVPTAESKRKKRFFDSR